MENNNILTDKQKDLVFRLMLKRFSTQEIADCFNVSIETLTSYLEKGFTLNKKVE